jgi:polyisoprenoid-binding protein YceI
MHTNLRLASQLVLLVSVSPALNAAPIAYEIDSAHSTVLISSPDSRGPFEASVANLAGDLRLDGDQRTPRSLELVFDLASLESGNASLDGLLRGPKYLWVARNPYGVTIAANIRASSAETFQADSTLTLRDSSCKAPVSFNWRIVEENGLPVGYLHGTSEVRAQDFRIQNTDPWDRMLAVTYDLRLTPASGSVPPVTRRPPETGLVGDEFPSPQCSFASQSAGAFSPETVRARQSH